MHYILGPNCFIETKQVWQQLSVKHQIRLDSLTLAIAS